ncbi:helix-turn-helix domain-containing protein [Listeria booriae]|uniref:Helix-turn-helix domain-containing protein n=1 Tax=Listeria booriae TaxID=1552123 RepID=A0A7X0YYZ1_9LIST|nr:helix-turn-helix domain-containing protein [Listeria booriae]MBC1286916.1 helix-turn-helix domain-containing protein [Listeria booriae]MBC1290511.1 helix-turn-helix domain-containing protein [Listeria booriae]MBC1331067.1 helix-turn-helix domain-containing protein [Listeria booriae]MBC1615420.1 helix-turn-helix domain-containing protein [Listeria booriae]MBC2166184.1 helix-turn-helix domain-containing protein [Listeria booriae]
MATRQGFTIITNRVIDDERLGGADKLVFMAICRYAHNKTRKCHPSRATLMKKASVSKKPFQASLKKLEECGYIQIERRTSNGLKLSNEYTVMG